MKITFITSGHLPKDDRIYYHQARTLTDTGNSAEIISSKQEFSGSENSVGFNCFEDISLSKKDKIAKFIKLLQNSKPDIIICSEPLTILAASRYKKQTDKKPKIIYDITEWYPSKKFLTGYNSGLKAPRFFKLLIFNLMMAAKADAFIFGEWYKGKPYRFLFPGKKFLYSGYYPDLKYIRYREPGIEKELLRLSYSGKLSIEKGFGNFLETIELLTLKRPGLKIRIKIIGWYDSEKEQKIFEKMIASFPENVSFKFYPMQDYLTFIELINDTDIFLDLRSDDFENQRCLPIKLFYYAALKRPVIFTNLKAIRKEVDISKFGHLVKPDNIETISGLILNYIDNQTIYNRHCTSARKLAESKYNWGAIKDEFTEFLQKLIEE